MPISLRHQDTKVFSFYTRNKKTYERSEWIQIYRAWDGIRFMIGIGSYFDRRIQLSICLGFVQFYIDLPIYTKYDECDPPRYGFYYYASGLWFCLGTKVKKISMPYEYDWLRTSCLRKDGTWEHETNGNDKSFYEDKWKDILWIERHAYRYTLKDGTIQQRIATIRVEEREWRQRWLKWTTLFSMVRKSINIDFDKEVGERTGSWKGGVLGCSYHMKHGELPIHTLRRMESERKFT